MSIVTLLIVSIIVAIVFSALGIYLTTTKLRASLTKKSAQTLVEAEEKAEMVKKEKILQKLHYIKPLKIMKHY